MQIRKIDNTSYKFRPRTENIHKWFIYLISTIYFLKVKLANFFQGGNGIGEYDNLFETKTKVFIS